MTASLCTYALVETGALLLGRYWLSGRPFGRMRSAGESEETSELYFAHSSELYEFFHKSPCAHPVKDGREQVKGPAVGSVKAALLGRYSILEPLSRLLSRLMRAEL